jgi:nucleotide-binding universal stress UspA family protein
VQSLRCGFPDSLCDGLFHLLRRPRRLGRAGDAEQLSCGAQRSGLRPAAIRAVGEAESYSEPSVNQRQQPLIVLIVRCTPVERITPGNAYRAILDVAGEGNAELIVMGVHGPQSAVRVDNAPRHSRSTLSGDAARLIPFSA